jgi:hypothetical protein
MTPLATWICDTCGDAIESAKKGDVVWYVNDESEKHGFKIVHKGPQCDLDRSMQSQELSALVGTEGQAHLLSWLSYGPIKSYGDSSRVASLDEYVDLFRRLQAPWYEEARPHFHSEAIQEQYSDSNEIGPYEPHSLKAIADQSHDVA